MVIVWDMLGVRALHKFSYRSCQCNVTGVDWISADEIAAGYGDGTVNIFKFGQAEPVKTLRCQVVELMNEQALTFIEKGSVFSLRWNAIDRRLASGCHDGSIQVTHTTGMVIHCLIFLNWTDLGAGSGRTSRHHHDWFAWEHPLSRLASGSQLW